MPPPEATAGGGRAARTRRAQAASCLLLVFLLLATPAAAGAAQPIVHASAYRVDLGHVAPGDAREGAITLSNSGPGPAYVAFAQEGSPRFVRLAEPLVLLPEGESRRLAYALHVPANATPGNHEESVKLLVGSEPPRTAERGGGTLVAGTAVLFRARVAAAGIVALEGPTSLLPGGDVAGRVIVLNAANATANLTVRIALANQTGALLRNDTLGPARVAPGASVAIPYAWADPGLTPGGHVLRATLHADNASIPVATAASQLDLHVGHREIAHRVLGFHDNGDGSATASIELRNAGTLPALFTPRLRFQSLDDPNRVIEIDLDPILLQPGETRLLDATADLPPGRFGVSLSSREEATFLRAVDATPATLAMAPPDAPIPAWAWGILASILLAAGLAAAGLVLRKRRAPRVRRVPVLATADALDQFLSTLEAEERDPAPRRIPLHHDGGGAAHAPVALLADPARLYGVPGHRPARADLRDLLAHAAAGRPLARAIAYYAAEDEPHARQATDALARAGYEPHVRSGPTAAQEIRVRIALDAATAARAGHVVVLATHDAALAEVARHLREQGHRCEILGIEGHVPPRLAANADHVHLIPAEAAKA